LPGDRSVAPPCGGSDDLAAIVVDYFDFVFAEWKHREGAAALTDGFAAAKEVVGVNVGGEDRSWFFVLCAWLAGVCERGGGGLWIGCAVTMHDRRRPRQDARPTFRPIGHAGDEIAVGFVGRFDAVDGTGHFGEQGGIV